MNYIDGQPMLSVIENNINNIQAYGSLLGKMHAQLHLQTKDKGTQEGGMTILKKILVKKDTMPRFSRDLEKMKTNKNLKQKKLFGDQK